jgi:phosphonate transport system substrate-binding protein
VQSRVLPSYQALVDEISNRRVHIAWLPPLTYLYASRIGVAQAALLANHFGVFQYGSQFLANTSSGFTPYFDPISGLNSADAATALAQFNGLRPCWVDPGSASGYIVPAGLLALNQIPIGEPAFTQSHSSVVRSLYVKGVCDFGGTFAISGDPRTASTVLQDLPDAIERIPIIWRSDAIIPNLNISYIAGLPEDRVKALNASFLQIAQQPEGLALLSSTADNYQVDALKPVDDSVYDRLREFVDALDLSLANYLGK